MPIYKVEGRIKDSGNEEHGYMNEMEEYRNGM